MPRLVQHNSQKPVEIKAQKKSSWVCQCGLSKNQPYCDGSHLKTQDEETKSLYAYDKSQKREKLGQKPKSWSTYYK